MNQRDFELISEIETIRRDNNINWMAILRIALAHAPDQTRVVLKDIMKADHRIVNITRELISDEDSQPRDRPEPPTVYRR